MPNERNIRVNTPLGPEALLFEHMSGHEVMSRPFEYKLDLLSPDSALDLSALLGQTVTVDTDIPGEGGTRYFNGYVTSFSMVGTAIRYTRYQLTLRPWLWLLSLTSNCRIFQNQSVPDIVKQVCRDHGFTDFRDALTGSYRSWEYCVQYRETDLNFINRLLDQEGIYYFFEHLDDKHTLVLADSPGAHVPAPGYATVPYFPPDENAMRERDHLSSWTVGRQIRPAAFVSTDYDFKRPKANLLSMLKAPLEHGKAEFEVYDYPGEFLTNDDGEKHVRVRLEEQQADFEIAEASGNATGLGVGGRFRLENYPREDQNKEYLIVSASYEVHTNRYESGTGGGENEFLGSYQVMDIRKPYRSPSDAEKPKVDGPHTAVVVGKAGEEIWTDEYGRVKVQFHWDRDGKADENSSCWVRVAQVWAGARWGAMHIPRIGQEVIVEFLEGDPDRPIITGRVYNAVNMPPYELPANQTQSGIKSRSTKAGAPANFNELRFEDKKGSEQVYLQAEKDLEILVKNDEARSVGHDRSKNVKNNETVDIGVNRSETVGADETIHIGGNRKEEVAKDESVKITGARNKSVGKDETISIAGSHSHQVAKDQSLSVSGNRSLTVNGKRNETVDKDDELHVGKTLLVSAGDEIVIKSGAASFTLKRNGDIVIKGKNVTIDGSANVNVKATLNLAIKGKKVTAN